MPQCKHHKRDGQRCRAHAMCGSRFCFSHNPEVAELKRAATRKGGRNRRAPERAAAPADRIRIKTIEDVERLLFRTLEELRNSELDANVARSLGYLSSIASKVHETVELERRVSRLEENVVEAVEALED